MNETNEEEEEEEKRRKRRLLLVLLLLLLLLLCLGGVAYYLFGRKSDTPSTSVTPTASSTLTTTTPPPTTAPPTTPPTATPSATAVQTISVPDVVGKTAAEAEQILNAAGFAKVTFGSADNPDDPVQILTEWKVTAQTPAAGQKVTPDTEIVVTVTKLGGGKG